MYYIIKSYYICDNNLNRKKMNLKNSVFGVLVTILISSCSTSPMERNFSEDNFDKDALELKEILTKEKFDLLTKYVFLKGVGGGDMSNQTYSDLLKEAYDFNKEEEEKLRKEKELKEEKYKQMVNEMYEQLKDK